MDPIHFKTPTTCIKSRQRKMIKNFFHRFYTPYSFIVWLLAATDINTCQNVPISIIIISLVAALTNAYETYTQWKTDIQLITNDPDPKMEISLSIVVLVTDFMIHYICIVLSFWWIDDLHTCIWIPKQIQLYIWITFFAIAIVLHVLQYNITQHKIALITKQAYSHVSSSSEII